MKRFIFILSILLFLYRENTYAMAGVTELGLNVASATMDTKSAEKGLSNVAKDQTKEWLWDSVGGFEKMLLQNDEAEIKEATGELLEIVDIVKSIETIAIAMTNGNYDTAAITAMDQVVGKVDHPLVSATWSAVKLTYESHKLVQSTEDARQVEILYHIVTHDRMLLGVSDPDSHMPPQIALSSENADYFFNKYIMTNDEARRALKAYVTTVLNQEWPEQSWSEWIGGFRTIGMGLDTRRNAELEMLDKEWRNKGRTWVMSVIAEINKQARISWTELKLRQQIAEFQEFRKSVLSFSENDLPRMLRDFQEIQTFKKEFPTYKNKLQEGIKLRKEAEQQVSSLNKKSFSKNIIQHLVSLSSSWEEILRIYSARARLLHEKEFVLQCDKESNAWRKVKNEITEFIIENGDTAGNELVEEEINIECKLGSQNSAPKAAAAMLRYCQASKEQSQRYFKMYEHQMEPFVWEFVVHQEGSFYIPKKIKLPAEPQQFSKELLKVLNRGEIRLGGRMYSAWKHAAENAFLKYSYLMQRASKGYFEYQLPDDLPKNENTELKRAKYAGWQSAKRAIYQKARVTYLMETEKYIREIASIAKIITSFQNLQTVRKEQWKLYQNHLSEILLLDNKATIDKNTWRSAKNKCSKNAYTKLPPLDKGVKTVNDAIISLKQIRYKIISSPACLNPDALLQEREIYAKLIKELDIALKKFKKLPKLTSADIKAISVFSQSDLKLLQDKKKVYKIQKGMENTMARIKKVDENLKAMKESIPLINQMISISTRDIANRERDILWLEEKTKLLESFVTYLREEKLIKQGYSKYHPKLGLSVVLPKDFVVKNGMIYSNKSPIHYLNESEIASLINPLLRSYNSSEAKRFLLSYFPKAAKNFHDFVSMEFVHPAKENIIILNKVVYLEDLKALEHTLTTIKVSQNNFDKKIQSIPKCFPSIKNFRKYYFNDIYVDKKELIQTKLGKKYLKLRTQVKEKLLLRKAYLVTSEQEANRLEQEAKIKIKEVALNKEAFARTQKEEEIMNAEIQRVEAIESLYTSFAQNYSNRDFSGIMSLIADDWESSSDGTTLMDLEETLENSFSIFDEVQCSIYSLNITKITKNRYRTTYVINIKGFIYDEDIEHTEKSSVSEEVIILDGTPKIFKTLSGKYWNKN